VNVSKTDSLLGGVRKNFDRLAALAKIGKMLGPDLPDFVEIMTAPAQKISHISFMVS